MAKLLGTTGDALYTRQRALVTLGALDVVKGRGPGSGTALNAHGVAGILIALLAADTLQDTDQRVLDLCRAPPREGKCPLTGATDFQSAVATVLASRKQSKNLRGLIVYRPHRAQILYGGFSESHGSVFDVPKPTNSGTIRISARLDAANARQISAMLTAALAA